MGNNTSSTPSTQSAVVAQENTATPPAPPPPGVTPPTPPHIDPTGHLDAPAEPSTPSANPGTYEELHKKCRELFPQSFEGGKIVIGKALSSHFQVNHNLTLSNPVQSGYRFGATYVGSKQFGPQESYPVLLGDIDASGNLNANIIHAFSKQLTTRTVVQFQGAKANFQGVMDYKADTWTSTATLVNPDLVNGSGMLISQYLQRVTPHLDVGAECMYQKGGQVPGGQTAFMSLAGRLHGEKWSFSANVNASGPAGPGWHASFYQKVNDSIQIGAELETSIGMGQSIASVGYQVDVPSTGATFKAQLDTTWGIQSVLEKKLIEAQFPLTLALSAEGNPVKSEFKFGVGIMLG